MAYFMVGNSRVVHSGPRIAAAAARHFGASSALYSYLFRSLYERELPGNFGLF
jgi:hypothetical protein